MTLLFWQQLMIPLSVLPGRQDADLGFPHSFANSPRRFQLHDVGNRTIGNGLWHQLTFRRELYTEPSCCYRPLNIFRVH